MIFQHQQLQMNSPVGLWPIINDEGDLQQLLLKSESVHEIDSALLYIDKRSDRNFIKWIEKIGNLEKTKIFKEKKKQEDAENSHIKYGLGGNFIHLRRYNSYIDYWCDYRI